jgi:hypothetical protein
MALKRSSKVPTKKTLKSVDQKDPQKVSTKRTLKSVTWLRERSSTSAATSPSTSFTRASTPPNTLTPTHVLDDGDRLEKAFI